MAAFAARVAALTGWRRGLLALILGAGLTAAQPPVDLVIMLVPGFTGLCWLLDGARGRRGRFVTVWCFAFGHYLTGVYWISESFYVDAERYAWLVPVPLLVLPAVMALLPAAGFAAAPWPRAALARPFALAAIWLAVDWLKAYGLLGFPWNLAGQAWDASTAMLQAYALLGIFGASLLTVLIAALPATLGTRHGRLAVGAGMVTLAAWWGLGSWRLAVTEIATVPGVQLRLVQANIAQQQKWLPEERFRNLERQIELSAGGAATPTHIVWPETAVPFLLDAEPRLLQYLAEQLGPETVLLAGALRRSPPGQPVQVWNSLHVVQGGQVLATYDKRHLVPFGEFLPYRPLMSLVGLDRVALSAVDFSAGESGDGRLPVPGAPLARTLICYEAIFPAEVRDGAEGAGWLVNVTNDAWFGVSAGPYQHLAAARARAVELGLPLVRVAGTGVSAVIDPLGRFAARLELGTAGTADSPLPAAINGRTVYHRFGDSVFGALWLLCAIAAFVTRR
ncbi:apolipoprotein N-acyltransferase [Desertibaculum subflavum]|uniref:apolipoprotein N-acyltransferase n=1 Tax=Desertibaculum subflavum TaxID=2268458 RepID=UPI000E6640EF